MFFRVEVGLKPHLDPIGPSYLRKCELALPDLRTHLRGAWGAEVYGIEVPEGHFSETQMRSFIQEIFKDEVLQLAPPDQSVFGVELSSDEDAVFFEKHYKPGVTDNVGKTAKEALEIVAGKEIPGLQVSSGVKLVFSFLKSQSNLDFKRFAKEVFSNELIEAYEIYPVSELKVHRPFSVSTVQLAQDTSVQEIPLLTLTFEELEKLSTQSLWALSGEEMQAIQRYFQALNRNPTDVELEILAQTWSEHCKHKIFNAEIEYTEAQNSSNINPNDIRIPTRIESLFRTTISQTTKDLPKPWLISVFSDNAGIVAFDEEHAVCLKVETHNSPSALDPYGGALTGIVGVNRDILGCGLGAKPIFNTDVFCVAPLDWNQPLPERLLPPRRILEGVRKGVEHGGNKSGIPTVNGALVFDDRYLGKPLVYCGTGGILPKKIKGRACHLKEVKPKDRIFMVGGRIGKDGIHGATFSSLALDEHSPVSAVQLGDPITQKRMADFLLEARDQELYRAITDNGAGGLSSSVGEMATLSGGARIDVAHARTKYPGLKPFELVISESQERMTLAVPPEKAEAFCALARARNVEVSDLGEFTGPDHGCFEILMKGQTVGKLSLEFLHKGTPKLKFKAHWQGSNKTKSAARVKRPLFDSLKKLLARPNIASKEWLVRQYDHEVQGMSVIKPLESNDGAVLKPKANSDRGLVVACGIQPKLSDHDPYVMAQASVDEAVRNAVAAGAEYGNENLAFALVDNFCWPDPVSNPDSAAALVRACFGLREAALALGLPLISGKDSMKNDYKGVLNGKPIQISVVPTLLMTALGVMRDHQLARGAAFQKSGDVIYRLGLNQNFLRGSEFEAVTLTSEHEILDEALMKPDWELAKRLYRFLSVPEVRKLLRSIHDLSEGGLLTAIAEEVFPLELGARLVSLSELQAFGEGFHQFVVSLDPKDEAEFLKRLESAQIFSEKIGELTDDGRLAIESEGDCPVSDLKQAWLKQGYWE